MMPFGLWSGSTRTRSGGARRRVLAAACLVALAACASTDAAPLPPSPPVIDVTMRDYAFDFGTPVPRGRVVFRVRNAGDQVHRMTLVYLPKDVPPLAEQVAGTERVVVDALAGIPNRPPGAVDRVAVDLDPGRWAMVCFIIDPEGTSHARKGMASEFEVK